MSPITSTNETIMSTVAEFLPASASVKPPVMAAHSAPLQASQQAAQEAARQTTQHLLSDLTIDTFDADYSLPHADTTYPHLQAQARQAHRRMLESMQVIRDLVKPKPKLVRAGDVLYRAGQPFDTVFLITAGAFKLVSRSLDGREQIVSLKFRGDWLGFSGIASGRHACDAVAMDTGNVSIIPYDSLAEGCARHSALMAVVHSAMSTEIGRERESLMSVCTLASQARVAEFLCAWARSMAQRGLRADELTLRMTRADLGNYLGMTLETVSRCLSRLARDQLIRFGERGRRQITIPDLAKLENYVVSGTAGSATSLQ